MKMKSFINLTEPIFFWLSERTKVSAKKSRPSLLDEIEKKVQGRSLTLSAHTRGRLMGEPII